MAQETSTKIQTADFSATQDWKMQAGMKFIANIGGAGTATLQYDDGNGTFIDYPDTGTAFGGWTPANGMIQLNVTAGTVKFGLIKATD